MTALRSLVFGLFFYGGVIVFGFAFIPLLLFPGSVGRPFFRAWLWYSLWIARILAGIRYDVFFKDGASFADGPAIYAAKHQSAWETIAFNLICPNPVFVLKEELTRIPFFGWYLGKMRMIAVNRSAGASAMRSLIEQGKAVTADGHSIVIYPQGTRVAPGVEAPYHPGVFALYKALDLPVVPIALNSGRLWARNGFIKRAGTITVSVLPAIPPGLDRKAFMAQLESSVEAETLQLAEH